LKEKNNTYQVYGYRWIILLLIFIITVIIEIQWLTFAPIAREAREAYKVSAMQIDLLAMVFMIVFLIVCIPASYVIDKYGIRIGVGIGAVLTGIFSIMKGIFAPSYTMMLVAQTGLGIAQPFILNSVTKVAAKWFPVNERATAVGLATLAQFVGFIVVMIVTPILVSGKNAPFDISGMLMFYGIISLALSVIFIILMRENPPTPPAAENNEERLLSLEGFKHIMRQRDMKIVLILFFIGLGMFNAITTCIDQICEKKGFTSEESGIIMGILLAAGIIGAVVLPLLSDKFRKRKLFILLGMGLMTPGLIGMTVAGSFTLTAVFAGIMGFFLLGAGAPIGFQYSAEVSYPAPESLSQGIILFAGQVSGIIFVIGMNTIGMITGMYIFIAMALINIILSLMLKESPMMKQT
jgi:sugar phosphate permease